MKTRRALRLVGAVLLTAAVALVARYGAALVHVPPRGFFPPSFVVHTLMLALSLVLIWLLSRGQLALYGLTAGTYKFSPRILMWVLPTAVLSTVSALASPGGQHTSALGELTKAQIIVFVWVYASISEELLTRGLLQTLLSSSHSVEPPARRRLSLPVIVSALFFGAMHIVLVGSMGPRAVPVIVLAVCLGLVAGRYREHTGSLIPAIVVHGLFNIGGMLPLWVFHWLGR